MARSETRENSKNQGKMPASISDALQLLDQHMSVQGEELFSLFGSGVNAIRQLISAEITPRLKETLSETAGKHLEGSRGAISKFDEQIRENPWRVAGGIALSALFMGYFMGRANKSPRELLNGASNRSGAGGRNKVGGRQTQYS